MSNISFNRFFSLMLLLIFRVLCSSQGAWWARLKQQGSAVSLQIWHDHPSVTAFLIISHQYFTQAEIILWRSNKSLVHSMCNQVAFFISFLLVPS